MSYDPRPYQETAVTAVYKEWEEAQSTLVVMPTGTGKTVMFAEVIRRKQPDRSMVLAHREELIWQARDKIEKMTGLDCDIEMADYKASQGTWFHRPVVISTIQSQIAGRNGYHRMSKFKPTDFGLLVIDEGHHATAESYRQVIDYYKQNPKLKILGVTATPDRADEEALGQIFETVAFDYEILDAINDGYLVPIEQQLVRVSDLDYSGIRTTAGDLNGADLAKVLEEEKTLQGMASASLQIIGNRKSIVFTASVAQAEMMSEIFNRHRHGMAAFVYAGTPKEVRAETLKAFSQNRIQVVCNCGILTEGYDEPGVEVIVMARPTKSRSLYSQMIGRSTRPLPGIVDAYSTADARKGGIKQSRKPSCLVIDFVGNSGRHKLVTSADILGGKLSDEVIDRAKEKAEQQGGQVRMDELLEETRLEIEERKRREAERKARITARASYKTIAVDPFDLLHVSAVRERGWDNGKHLSEKQNNLLRKAGLNPDDLGYSRSKQMIGVIIDRWKKKLCTPKQAALLNKHGIDAAEMSMTRATQVIDRLAAHRWQSYEGILDE